MSRRSRVGRAGEQAAVEALKEAGYVIVQRNVRIPGGEIDVIARDGDTIVFVEVKTRTGRLFGSAISGVDARKRRKLRALAADYLQIAAPGYRARFDVVSLDGERITLHKAAFS